MAGAASPPLPVALIALAAIAIAIAAGAVPAVLAQRVPANQALAAEEPAGYPATSGQRKAMRTRETPAIGRRLTGRPTRAQHRPNQHRHHEQPRRSAPPGGGHPISAHRTCDNDGSSLLADLTSVTSRR